MLNVTAVKPADLTPAERAAWQAFVDADPALASPYFSLGFLDAVNGARRDTRVLVARRRGDIIAFLPLHAGLMGHARPLAGPLGDHHGLIAAPGIDLDLGEMLKAGGVGVFGFHGGLAGQAPFRRHALERDGSWVIDLSGGYDAFVEARCAVDAKAFRNLRARRRKLEGAEGGFDFRINDDRPEVLQTALAWKSAQYKRTGVFDAFSVRWTVNLLNNIKANDCRLQVSSLEIGGRLAAVHVGMRTDRVLHYWFPAYDPEFSSFGPGLALLMEICQVMAADGVSEVHLGPGDYDFKSQLASWQIGLVGGFAGQGAPMAVQRAARALERGVERLPLGPVARLPGKAFRRIDLLAGFHAA